MWDPANMRPRQPRGTKPSTRERSQAHSLDLVMPVVVGLGPVSPSLSSFLRTIISWHLTLLVT